MSTHPVYFPGHTTLAYRLNTDQRTAVYPHLTHLKINEMVARAFGDKLLTSEDARVRLFLLLDSLSDKNINDKACALMTQVYLNVLTESAEIYNKTLLGSDRGREICRL